MTTPYIALNQTLLNISAGIPKTLVFLSDLLKQVDNFGVLHNKAAVLPFISKINVAFSEKIWYD